MGFKSTTDSKNAQWSQLRFSAYFTFIQIVKLNIKSFNLECLNAFDI